MIRKARHAGPAGESWVVDLGNGMRMCIPTGCGEIVVGKKAEDEPAMGDNHNWVAVPDLRKLVTLVEELKTAAQGVCDGNTQILNLSTEILESFCHRHHILKMAIFGSAIRDDFGDQSDIDILVEFEPDHTPGFKFFEIEAELSRLLGRKVDLQTTKFLSPEFRQQVLEEAWTAYEQA